MHDNPHASRVHLTKRYNADGPLWFASVNSQDPFPITDHALTLDADGNPVLSLALPVASAQIGEPPSEAQAIKEQAAKTWGAPAPDPREGIPGWTPPLAQQVVRNAEMTVGFRDSNPSAAMLAGIRDVIRLRHRDNIGEAFA